MRNNNKNIQMISVDVVVKLGKIRHGEEPKGGNRLVGTYPEAMNLYEGPC